MAEYNEAMVWSAMKRETHPSLLEEDRTMGAYLPLINDLFPGINYFSWNGFSHVMFNYVEPALSKMFPELSEKSAEEVNPETIVSIESILPSDGYEHMEDPWKKKLEAILEQL